MPQSGSHWRSVLNQSPGALAAAAAVLAVAVSTSTAMLIAPYATLEDVSIVYLIGIVLYSLRFPPKPSIAASALSVLVFDYIFVPPRWGFSWGEIRSALTFAALLGLAVLVSSLSDRLRRQERDATRAAERAQALLDLHRALGAVSTPEAVIDVAATHLKGVFGANATTVTPFVAGPNAPSRVPVTPTQSFDGHRWTTTIPLVSASAAYGEVQLQSRTSLLRATHHAALMEAMANQVSAVLDSMRLAQAVRRAESETETERVRNSLLSSISHDLRTPLASIITAGTALLENRSRLAPAQLDQLLGAIVREGERLGRVVENVLSITRLETTTLQLEQRAEPIEDVVDAALEHMAARLDGRPVECNLPAELPPVAIEPLLIEQALCNLLENAVRYSPAGSTIAIQASVKQQTVCVSISDCGAGIPPELRESVFEKFNRGARKDSSDGGMGLGLTISRAIAEAHGGSLSVAPTDGPGTTFELVLPISSRADRVSTSPPSSA